MYLLLYLLIIYGINFLHFLLYYYVSSYSYSIHNIIFTILFSLFLSWTITLSYKKWWKTINILAVIGIGFINIVNYLYYQVFNTFFNPFAQKAFVKEGSFAFFTKYIRDIPFSIYMINFAWITTLILLIVAYKPSYLRIEKLPFLHSIQGDKSYKKTKRAYLLFSIFIGIIMLISHYSYHLYLHNNPNSNWWDSKKQGQDYTIWGLFTYEKAFLPIHNFFIPPTTATEFVTEDQLYEELLEESKSFLAKATENKKEEIKIVKKIESPSIKELTDFEKLGLLKNKFQNLNTQNSLEKNDLLKNINIENPHIIMIQLESIASWGVDQEPSPMPFLKKLMAENYTVENFFANSCETINAEFASLCSFYPSSPGPISEYHKENDYYCLPELLKDKYNYESHIYHANYDDFWERETLTKKWGFENNHFSPEFQVRESDYQTLERLANDLSARKTPSFNYFVSFTSHSPHNQLYIDNYNKQNGGSPDIKLYNSPINQNILDNIELKEKTIRPYLSQLAAVDQSLEHFFKRLEKYNLLDKSIIIIYNDHRYYNFFPDDKIENFYNYNELPFVMVLPEKNKVELQKFVSHVDIAPTILDLLNYKEELPESFIGTSLFSNEHPNYVINKCLNQISYIDNNVLIKGNAKNEMYNIVNLFNQDINFYSYIPALSEYIELSDKILEENNLGK